MLPITFSQTKRYSIRLVALLLLLLAVSLDVFEQICDMCCEVLGSNTTYFKFGDVIIQGGIGLCFSVLFSLLILRVWGYGKTSKIVYHSIATGNTSGAKKCLHLFIGALLAGFLLSPSLTAAQTTRTICEGSAITFSSSPGRNQQVQWEVSNDNRNWTEIAGATSSSYSFTPNFADDGKYYRAQYYSQFFFWWLQDGNSAPVQLTVNPAPTVTDGEVCGSGRVTLTASGATTGGSYRWYASATSNSRIATGATFTTPTLTTTTTYYVSAYYSGPGCETTRVPVTATVDCQAVYSTHNYFSIYALTNGRTLATVTDQDGAITASTVSGTQLPNWMTKSANGTITVNNAAAAVVGTYNFTIVTTDAKNNKSTVPVTIEITSDLYQVNNDAKKLEENCYELTPNENDRRGEIWRTSTISLNTSFEVRFNAYLGDKDNGADGIAFVLQRATDPLFVAGSTGEGLGIGGVKPSVAVEFDTYQNTGDPAYDHTAIFKNGAQGAAIAGTAKALKVNSSNTPVNVEDNASHAVRIVWIRETNTLSVYFDGALLTSYSEDFVTSVFNGNPDVYFGYTASTGGSINKHSVCDIKYNAYPTTNNINTAAIPATAGATAINALSGADTDPGSVVKYIIKSVPNATTEGKLLLGTSTTALVVGSEVPVAQIGNLKFDPVDAAKGSATFTYAAVDNEGAEDQSPATYTIPINGRPSTPIDINTAANTVAENAATGTLVGITARSTDPDGGTITYTLTNDAGGRFAINSTTGVVTVANGSLLDYETAASHSIIVRASDGVVFSATQSFTIDLTNVNEAPVITSNGGGTVATVSVAENTMAVTQVTATDVDANTTLTYTIVGGADQGKFTINATTGALSFVSAQDYENPTDSDKNNLYIVIVKVTDNGTGALFDEQTITASVTNVNEPPVSNNIVTQTLLNTVPATQLLIPANAYPSDDSDVRLLKFKFASVPTSAQGTLTVDGASALAGTAYPVTSTINFDPVIGNLGDVVLNYTVIDADEAESNSSTFTIPINGEPVANNVTNPKLLDTAGNTALSVLSGNDGENPAGSPVYFQIVSGPAAGVGTLTVNGAAVVINTNYDWALANTLKFDPTAGKYADVTFTYTVIDGEGAEDQSPATFTIPINGLPTAVAVTSQELLNSAPTTTIAALVASDPDGAVKDFQIRTLPTPQQGVLYVNGQVVTSTSTYYPWSSATLLSFDPAPGNVADIVLTYRVRDADNAASAIASYIIPINGEPVATSITNGVTLLNTADATALTPLAGNDGERPAGTPAYFQITSAPTSGTLTVNNAALILNSNYAWLLAGTIKLDPAVENTADVTFTYIVKDTEGASSPVATYTVPVNGEPVAQDIKNSATLKNTAAATAIDALAANDLDGSIASFKFSELPAAGALSINGVAVNTTDTYAWNLANALKYTPAATNTADVSFKYTVVDGEGAADATAATFTIPINGVPTATAVTNATLLNTDDEKALTSLNGTDSDGPVAKFILKTVPASSLGVLRVNGVVATATEYDWALHDKLSFDPAFGSAADVVFTYAVVDEEGAESGTVNFSIPINRVPVAQDLTNDKLLNTAGPSPLTVNLFPSDDGKIISFKLTQLPDKAKGALTIGGVPAKVNKDYTLEEAFTARFDPEVANLSDVVFYYAVTDNEGATSAPASYIIPINGEPIAKDITNAPALSSSAGLTRLNALVGEDPDAGGSIEFFQFTTLPTAAQGILYVGVNRAELNKDYSWNTLLKGNIIFDPTYGNEANVAFKFTVVDNEGAVDASPATFTIPVILDYDVDGIADADDLDDDNDGIPDAIEGAGDKDGDGIKNSFDLDSDGDGITDVIEVHSGKAPINYNPTTGRLASAVGANGMPNSVETSVDSGSLKDDIPDTDGDGIPDFLDIDSDNDGILDNVEAQARDEVRRLPIGSDADIDGIDDIYDASCGCATEGKAIDPVDTEADNICDYLDWDSDEDEAWDAFEAHDADDDTKSLEDLKALALRFASRATGAAVSYYLLGDGEVPAWLQDADKNGTLNCFQPGNSHYHDSNQDGMIDLFDTYSYGEESPANPAFRDKDKLYTLPVVLLNLSATIQKNGVMINWATASEINNDYFIVERSQDGRSFAEVGKVKGAGNSNVRLNYNLLDSDAPTGIIYYRLKQVDLNGKATYSKVVSVETRVKAAALITLFPNPTSGTLNLDLTSLADAAYTVRIISMDGRLVREIKVTGGKVQQLDVTELSVAKYVLQLQGAQSVQTLNFIKQ